jgi:4-carboxymuconolactone decarboxylase
MNRLPYPGPGSVPAEVQALLDVRPPRNVFRMMAHAPALMPGIMELTGAILYRSKLDPLFRELAILRVGHLCGSSYEVHQHRKIAGAIGLSAEKIEATAQDADAALYDPREILVLRMAEQVVRQVKADDALFAATVAALGKEKTMELLIIIGLYVMLAQVLENAEVELEEGGGPAASDVNRLFSAQART